METAIPSRKKVVIIGGGFAGIQAAKQLKGGAVDVLLIDRNIHHTFQPLLYQTALAVLSPSDIVRPIRSILHGSGTEVLMAEVTEIDRAAQRVTVAEGSMFPYDYLILASGSASSYFGNDGWRQFSPSLKSIEDAVEIRSRILLAFEKAESLMRAGQSQPDLHFVVIGGGPTGVELAGAVSDVSKHVLKRDYRHLDPSRARITLYEGSPHILSAFPEVLQRRGAEQLEELGVVVRTNSHITEIASDHVVVNGEVVPSTVTLWAAGVAPSALGKELQVPLDKRGCVLVDQYLNPTGCTNVFVCGDVGAVSSRGKRIPATVQPAMQAGKHAAKVILADLSGRSRPEFTYFDKGDMATIGVKHAVAHIVWPFKANMSGLLAWLTWLFIHLLYLSGADHQISVVFTWVYSYITRTARSRMSVATGRYVIAETAG